jgi:hypothetical protein
MRLSPSGQELRIMGMSMLKGIWRNLRNTGRVQGLLVMALGCFVSVDGFGQLIYLTDARSVSGSAAVNNVSQYSSPPYYTTSYTGDFSGSAMPSSLFADFNGNANGTATFQGGIMGGQALTIGSTVNSSQNSFLHSQELYFSSSEGSTGTPFPGYGQPSSQWHGQGESSLQVTFQVASPITYSLSLWNTGDPMATLDIFSLTSSGEGTLASENTGTMPSYEQQWNTPIEYSGTFTPGNTYTLTLDSKGSLDGGGLTLDLVVPEPSMTALAGFAFVIFLLRVRRAKERMVPVRIPTERGRPRRGSRV